MNLTELYREAVFDAADAPVGRLVEEISGLIAKTMASLFQSPPDEIDEPLCLERLDFSEQLVGAAFVVCQAYITNVVSQVFAASAHVERRTGAPLSCGGPPILEMVTKLRELAEKERMDIEHGKTPEFAGKAVAGERKRLRRQIECAQIACRTKLLDRFGERYGGPPAAKALNAAANYWKHRDEWGSDSWNTAPAAREQTVTPIRSMGLSEATAAINMTLAAKYFGVPTESHDLAPMARAASEWAWGVAGAVSEELEKRNLVSAEQKWVSKRIE